MKMKNAYVYSNELYHHGIKGQQWGVRRYQNEDGTYTAEGRSRYGIKGAMSGIRQKIHNFRVNRARKYGEKMANRASRNSQYAREEAEEHRIARDDLKKNGRHSQTYAKWKNDQYDADVEKYRSALLDEESDEVDAETGQRLKKYSYNEANNSATVAAGAKYLARSIPAYADMKVGELQQEHHRSYKRSVETARIWERANRDIMNIPFDEDHFKEYRKQVKTAYKQARGAAYYNENDG